VVEEGGNEEEKEEEEDTVEGETGEKEAAVVLLEPARAVKWLFRRLSHVARRYNGQRRSCVFEFFAAMGVRMGPGALIPLLPQVPRNPKPLSINPEPSTPSPRPFLDPTP
jgi:hypothetical protein